MLVFSNRYSALRSGTMLLIVLLLTTMANVSFAGHYALLIGVGEYARNSGLQNLPHTASDVQAFEQVLKKFGYNTHMLISDVSTKVPLGQLPTHDNMEKRILMFLADKFESDSVILVFAGHGVLLNGKSYICPGDTLLDTRKNLISVDWIHERLAECKANQITFFCDACQEELLNGDIKLGAQNVEGGVGLTTEKDLDAVMAKYRSESKNGINQRKLTVVQSCSPKQFARVDRKLGQSVFFHYLTKGIQGPADHDRNGLLEHEELINYVAENVRDYVFENFQDSQIVYRAITGNSDVPLMVFEARPTWMPANCTPPADARLVELPDPYDSEKKIRLFSHLTCRPQRSVKGSLQPWLMPDGTPMEIVVVLVPKLRSSDPDSFYIMRDKVIAGAFTGFERVTNRLLDAEAARLRREANLNPAAPAFLVTGLDAIEFADAVMGGKLPSPQQWDAAFGRFYDSDVASNAKYPRWSPRDASHPEWAVNLSSALTRDRENVDESPWGVRDMAANGMELTRFDQDWLMMIPHQHEPSSMMLRGRSYRAQDPLTLNTWKTSSVPDDILFGTQGVRSPAADVGFRVVLEQPQP